MTCADGRTTTHADRNKYMFFLCCVPRCWKRRECVQREIATAEDSGDAIKSVIWELDEGERGSWSRRGLGQWRGVRGRCTNQMQSASSSAALLSSSDLRARVFHTFLVEAPPLAVYPHPPTSPLNVLYGPSNSG